MSRTLIVLAAIVFCQSLLVLGSSHSEAPGTAGNPSSDLTDFYFFRSYEAGRANNLVLMLNIYGLQNPFGGPNYFTLNDNSIYEIHISCGEGTTDSDYVFQFYTGATMGGNNGTFETFDETSYCPGDNVPYKTTAPSGVALPVGTGANLKMIPIPLKVFGPIDTDPATWAGGLNWFEYYYLNFINKGNTQSLSPANGRPGRGGSNSFGKPFDYVGEKTFASASDYEEYSQQFIYNTSPLNTCGESARVFLGQRAEPFSVNLGQIFDLINFIPIPGFPNAIANCNTNNVLRSKNVVTFALEVPIECLQCPSNVLSAWARTTTLVHTQDGQHVPGEQTNRLGNPLINEVVIGLPDKKFFSTSNPSQDLQFLDYVTNPTFPEIVNILFLTAVNAVLGTSFSTIAPTNIPRNDLVTTFLTGIPGVNSPPNVVPSEMLRLNVSVAPTPIPSQSPYGVIGGDVAGFPNGRRPGDDVIDIAIRVMMGALCYVGGFGCSPSDAVVGNVAFLDGAPVTASYFGSSFPFFNTPNPGSINNTNAGSCPPPCAVPCDPAPNFLP